MQGRFKKLMYGEQYPYKEKIMAACKTKDYDPKKVKILLGGHLVGGFSDGTFLSISTNNPLWTLAAGASGEFARSKSNDKSATIEITLMQTSISNNVLSSFALSDTTSNTGKFLLTIVDENGFSAYTAAEAWVQQMPSVSYGKEISDVSWTIETGCLSPHFAGGTTVDEGVNVFTDANIYGNNRPVDDVKLPAIGTLTTPEAEGLV